MSLSSADPRAATLVAQLTAATNAIALVQPEAAATTSSLVAVAALVSTALTTATALLTTLSTTTNPADAQLYIWVLGVCGNLRGYLGSLQQFTGQDNSNSSAIIGGTTLFAVAAQYLNDWTRAFDIGSVQTTPLMDPSITGATSLTIPRS